MVSKQILNIFHNGSRISKERLETLISRRLIVGSSCYNGDVFEAALNLSDEKLGTGHGILRLYWNSTTWGLLSLSWCGNCKDTDELIKSYIGLWFIDCKN